MKTVGTLLVSAIALLAASCTTTPQKTTLLKQSEAIAWSLKGAEDEMVVRVSPAGRTLRVAGSAGALVGGSVDALVNDRYRQQIREAAGDWNAAETVQNAMTRRLEAGSGLDLDSVPPAGSTAGYASEQEAAQVRYRGLKQAGYEALLDVNMTYGLFGPRVQPVVVLDTRVINLDTGNIQWRRELAAVATPVLVTDPLRLPTERLKPTIANARLQVEDEAVKTLIADGAAPLKRAMEQTAEAAASMLLTALDLEDSYEGHYQLGRMALFDKDFKVAAEHFEQALELSHGAPEATNALAVTRAHQGDVDQAVALSRVLADEVPNFAPGHFNLAFWLAGKGEMQQARQHYAKAQELGLPPHDKLDRLLELPRQP